MLSVCLSRLGYKIKHIDNRPVPTATGRADGIQPRTLEILRNLNLKRKIMAYDPARVYEVAFWDPVEGGKISRTGTWASCPAFLDARYPFTALLHQGLIERVMIDDMNKNGNRVQRPWTITGFTTSNVDHDYPVEVSLKNLDTNVIEHIRTKYLYGAEGGRSFVREQLGVAVRHKDPISHVWGVMDGVVRTNFPDIKMKCTIHSDHGSIMVIPRENNMVRLYIQIASSSDPDFNPRKTATVEEVQEAAKRILQPYYVTWDRVEWYSVYPIGQGIAEKYTLDHRVFMGGDTCHTHSPKAGQGMNTAFHDSLNLAWKIHAVESGFADRSILSTYEEERKYIAETLLNFDNKYAALFSQRQPSAQEVGQAHDHSHSTDPSTADIENPFVKTFKENCEFTAGFGVAYKPNIFNYSPDTSGFTHPSIISGSPQLRSGRIIPPADVTRVSDANPVHLENEIRWNGAFRLFVFGGSNTTRATKYKTLFDLETALRAPKSFYSRFSYPADVDTHHSVDRPHSPLYSVALTIADKRANVHVEDLPALFRDYTDRVYADDVWSARVPNAKAAAHAKMGLGDAETADGAIVVVRPDGHVGVAVSLKDGKVKEAVEALELYFGQFMAKGGRPSGVTRLGGDPGAVRAQL